MTDTGHRVVISCYLDDGIVDTAPAFMRGHKQTGWLAALYRVPGQCVAFSGITKLTVNLLTSPAE